MARECDDLKFWLPSEFLTEDELSTDIKIDRLKTKSFNYTSYGFGNSFGLKSDLSSPTTETESDDDELISGLTRKLAHSVFLDSDLSYDYPTRGWKLSGSPQSTLCGCKPGARGSPSSVSGMFSPTAFEDERRLELLYAAAGEIARMRSMGETAPIFPSKLYAPYVQPNPFIGHERGMNPVYPFYPNHQGRAQSHISYQKLQAAKFQQVDEQERMKDGVSVQGFSEIQHQDGGRHVGDARAQGAPMSNWPILQQPQHQPGSAFRPGFLGKTELKKERTGTGVFLPQRYGSIPSETRKKPDAVLNHRNSLTMAQKRRSLSSQPVMKQQLTLRKDWTY